MQMAVGPITYTEILAYRQLTLADLSAWDVALIRRLDMAIRAITSARRPDGEIPASDGRAVTGMLRGLAAKRNALNPKEAAK